VKKSLKVNSALELEQRVGLRANRHHDGAESRRLLQGQQHEYEVIAFGAADEAVKATSRTLRRLHHGCVRALCRRLKLANPADHAVLPEVISKSRSARWCVMATTNGSIS